MMKRYPQVKGPDDVIAPVGTANAYDAMHLLARAIDRSRDPPRARRCGRPCTRSADYEGLIKTYDPALHRGATTTR